MSAGAVFKLIANDGKADKLITASELLKSRLVDIACDRRSRGLDPTPLLSDIEKTHVLYVHSHFKPHAAIGFEYNKVRGSSGHTAFGMSVQFSIPQFGDFFNDMVVRTRIGRVVPKAGTVTLTKLNLTDDDVRTHRYAVVDAFGKELLSSVDNTGAAVAVDQTASYTNFVRYCKFPGNRLFETVKFEVNGNPLDEYNYLVPVMFEKFSVPLNKRIGYERLCGQEVARVGYGPLKQAEVVDRDFANTKSLGLTSEDMKQSNQTVALFAESTFVSTPSGTFTTGVSSKSVVGAVAATALSADATSSSTGLFDICRQEVRYVNGPQTPKPVQPALELWTPLLFWFNKDVRDSIASVSIPFGMRFITIQICQQNELVFEYPSIYHRVTTTDSSNQTVHSYTPIMKHNGINDVTIEKMEMYINNIFVNPEIHDVFIQRISFSLVRVYRQQQKRVIGDDDVQLNQIKWPVEHMLLGIRPTWNIAGTTAGSELKQATISGGATVPGAPGSGTDPVATLPTNGNGLPVTPTPHSDAVPTVAGAVKGNPEKWQDWYKFTYNPTCVVDPTSSVAAYSSGNAGAPPSLDFKVVSGAPTTTTYSLPVSTIDTLSLTAHGIVIYEAMSDLMFNQYIPYTYGGCAVNTPEDTGVMMVNFSLFPGQKQPAGHLNVSRARETFVKFESKYLSPGTPGDLCIVAYCLNFLLISDGSAVLRFST